MKVEKFPKFFLKGKELLWDSRQNVSDPCVVIRKGLAPELEKNLLTKSPQVIYEGKDFPSWGTLVSDLVGNPSRQLKIIGVVGTSGKTTTASLIRFLLVHEGKRVLEIGTFGVQLWASKNNESPLYSESTGYTTPDAHILQDLLRQAIKEEVDYVVMEVTSHAIALGRIAGVEFDAGIFLNFSQDHLDFHQSLHIYKNIKKSFFTTILSEQATKKPYVVINANDPVGVELEKEITVPFDVLKRNQDYVVDESSLEVAIAIEPTLNKIEKYPFVGHFLAENIISAAKVVSALLGLKTKDTLENLKKFQGVAGRMEVLHLNFNKKRRNFIVDYAHKPDALEKNLQCLKMGTKKGKLWVLFGCGGDRDPLKRPLMGEIAGKYADHIVVTSDNPRNEDPSKIIEEIVAPLKLAGKTHHIILSRRDAMQFCMEKMEETDLCLVAGRGAEDFQIVKEQKIPFRDSEVLKSLSC